MREEIFKMYIELIYDFKPICIIYELVVYGQLGQDDFNKEEI